MKTMLEILTVMPATQDDIENWLQRVDLRTEYAKTARGRARLYSRENAIELAALANFVRVGFTPSAAGAHAHMVVRHALHGNLREWFIGTSNGGIAVSSFNDDRLRKLTDETKSLAFPIVHMGEIVRRVDALFAEDEVKP